MWKFIKKLFGHRTKEIISYGELPAVKDALRPKQIIRAMNYYSEHVRHVELLMKETNIACDVSEWEDKNNPSLWKPGHWLWFFDKHKNNNETLKNNITKILYQNSHDDSECLRIRFEKVDDIINLICNEIQKK
jgi:hypothetical protein